MFCLDPPLEWIPRGEWFCHNCLFTTGGDFGFDEGEEHSLSSFQARDLEFRRLYFLSHPPPSVTLSGADPAAANAAGATAMHWAALNAQLGAVEALFKAGGAKLIDVRDGSGRSPLGVAEQNGWEEGARWMVERMDISDATAEEGEAAEDEKVDGRDIEVEIQDAEGGVARMAIGSGAGKEPAIEKATATPA